MKQSSKVNKREWIGVVGSMSIFMMSPDGDEEWGDETFTESKGIAENDIPRWKEVDVVGPPIDDMSGIEGAYEVLGNVWAPLIIGYSLTISWVRFARTWLIRCKLKAKIVLIVS